MRDWNMNRVVGVLAKPTLLVLTSLALVACVTPLPPDKVMVAIQACSGRWGAEVSGKLTAKYEGLKKGGEVEWKAAQDAGGTLLKHFKDDAKGMEAYTKYLECITPTVQKFVSGDDRPVVVVVGSKEDYTTYQLSELEATSAELLDKKLGVSFNVLPITVSYGWDNEESIRREKPAAIVMHASAFHHDQHRDEAVDKFQALLSSLYGLPKTKFIVFSRLPPEHPPQDLCQRWERQIAFLRGKQFRDRLVFYPMANQESNFKGKAGIEINQITRCLTELDAAEYCSVYLRNIEQKAQDLVAVSSCSKSVR